MVGGIRASVVRSLLRGSAVAALCALAALCAGVASYVVAAPRSQAVAAHLSPPERFGEFEPARPPPVRAERASAAGTAGTMGDGDPEDSPRPGTGQPLDVQSRAQALSVQVAGTPPLTPGQRVSVPLSFYYCELGAQPAPSGDGGGFCGAMRDGSTVYPGAAACDIAYMGQQFRIDGDPTGRTYRCADTGNLIHNLHRDIWFRTASEGWNWLLIVGGRGVIEILP